MRKVQALLVSCLSFVMTTTKVKEGVSEVPITPHGVVSIKEKGSEREAVDSIIIFDANDLVCVYCGCLIFPGPSNTEDKAH